MINRLLVANRGEIARRVFATCRRLGIETVAVHSDADADLPFVAEADLAVRLPGNSPAETYLDGAAVIAAALRAGADAIHPGYGFLSENADFARAVEAAGLIWVGPAPESIDAMGSKIGAKALMSDAGVPTLQAPDAPTEADLPLLVKASAGGGGRGMRIVRDVAALDAEIAAASAEAQSAFGDGTVFVEPYVEAGRHVEVQVLGDGRGEVAVVGERDCSVQRRHQKVIEEAPAPGLPGAVRSALHEAARKAASAIHYRGAGTVEFLYDPATERFFFLEMNTRLQVEHPVSELVHGVDVVEAQLAVAEGRAGVVAALTTRLGGESGLVSGAETNPHSPPVGTGGESGLISEAETNPHSPPPGESGRHAIEVRLYAEDPAAGYQPQSGRLATFEIAHDVAFDPDPRAERGVRLDAGFASGSEVSTFYDAMLAKVIAWAPSREQAIRILIRALRGARIHGLTTNRDQLIAVLSDPAFATMDVSTTWLETREDTPDPDAEGPDQYAVAAALALAEADVRARRVQQGVPVAWRNVPSQPQRTRFESGDPDAPLVVEWWGARGGGHGYVVDGVDVESVSPEEVRLAVGGVATTYRVTPTRGQKSPGGAPAPLEVWVDGPLRSACLRVVPRFTDPAAQHKSGSLLAPMPGSVVRVLVEAGAEVAAGDPVLVLEAMKMQHTVTAPHAGTVTEINVRPGSQVAAGELLAVVAEENQ